MKGRLEDIKNSMAWSEGRESDPLPSPWEGDILPVNYPRVKDILPLNRIFVEIKVDQEISEE